MKKEDSKIEEPFTPVFTPNPPQVMDVSLPPHKNLNVTASNTNAEESKRTKKTGHEKK